MNIDDWRRLAETGRFVEVPAEALKPGDKFFVVNVAGEFGEVVGKHFWVHVPNGQPN